MYLRLIILLATAAFITLPTLARAEGDESRPYQAQSNAHYEVDAALFKAKASGRRTLIIMGANWCHDSRSLAARFETERFQTLINAHYELVYVDVGQKNRNIDIAQRFGIADIVGTPTMMVVSSEGQLLNKSTAPSWRNAHERGDDDIFAYLEAYSDGIVLEVD